MPRDDGYSTFDKYRSHEQPPVGPQGIDLQIKCQSDNEDEREERSLRQAKRFQRESSPDGYFAHDYDNLKYSEQEWQPGGMTFRKGGVLG